MVVVVVGVGLYIYRPNTVSKPSALGPGTTIRRYLQTPAQLMPDLSDLPFRAGSAIALADSPTCGPHMCCARRTPSHSEA